MKVSGCLPGWPENGGDVSIPPRTSHRNSRRCQASVSTELKDQGPSVCGENLEDSGKKRSYSTQQGQRLVTDTARIELTYLSSEPGNAVRNSSCRLMPWIDSLAIPRQHVYWPCSMIDRRRIFLPKLLYFSVSDGCSGEGSRTSWPTQKREYAQNDMHGKGLGNVQREPPTQIPQDDDYHPLSATPTLTEQAYNE